jgi:integrase
MNFVEPIRDRKKIAQIKNLLRGQWRFRDLLLFSVGTNTALRISDLLQLKIGQFLDDRGRYKPRFWIHEQKRNKRQEVTINQSIQEALGEYLEALYLPMWSTNVSRTSQAYFRQPDVGDWYAGVFSSTIFGTRTP